MIIIIIIPSAIEFVGFVAVVGDALMTNMASKINETIVAIANMEHMNFAAWAGGGCLPSRESSSLRSSSSPARLISTLCVCVCVCVLVLCVRVRVIIRLALSLVTANSVFFIFIFVCVWLKPQVEYNAIQ